jgi:hypothetical protein
MNWSHWLNIALGLCVIGLFLSRFGAAAAGMIRDTALSWVYPHADRCAACDKFIDVAQHVCPTCNAVYCDECQMRVKGSQVLASTEKVK